MYKLFLFFSSMVIAFLPGYISSLLVRDNYNNLWYSNLTKSTLNPDGIVFAIVWPILYLLIGIVLYRIFSSKHKNKPELKFIIPNLILNTIWSFVFFNLHYTTLSLIIIAIMIYFLIKAQLHIKKYDKISSYLLIPYLIWLYFAGYLILAILVLN